MRMLFTFAGGSGHFEPLVPIARAAVADGHIVAFAGQPAMVATVEAAGFTMFATAGATVNTASTILPLLKLDMAEEDRVLREVYADRIARQRADSLLPLCNQWLPDCIVCDEVDFGSMVVAERLGLPYASVLVMAAGSFVRRELVAEPLNRVRADYGLPPDPELAMLNRYLVLSPFPPSFRDPAFPLPSTAHSFRLLTVDTARDEMVPTLFASSDGVPTVYFTLGTVFNLESGDLFTRVLAGLRDLTINVIATVGREIDPGTFGPQPANVRIERYVAQSLVLPQCDAVLSHGGSGSVLGSLAHGLPSVLIPMGADQPLNAQRSATLGIALVLDATEATPESVRDAVSTVLADPSYRKAAERMRDEIAALPGPAHALALIEQLCE